MRNHPLHLSHSRQRYPPFSHVPRSAQVSQGGLVILFHSSLRSPALHLCQPILFPLFQRTVGGWWRGGRLPTLFSVFERSHNVRLGISGLFAPRNLHNLKHIRCAHLRKFISDTRKERTVRLSPKRFYKSFFDRIEESISLRRHIPRFILIDIFIIIFIIIFRFIFS